MKPRAQGFTLIELLATAAVVMLLAAAVVPPLQNWSAKQQLHLAACELVGALHRARLLAIARRENVAVKLRTAADGRVSFTLYHDGDGDGVRNRDIDSGVDPQIGLPRNLRHFGIRVHFGFPPGKPPRDPGDPRRRLHKLHDPIRFNRSDLASFSPLGGSTPGSLYLTDGKYRLAVVRVFGRTGKIRILHYDPERERWR